MSTLVLYNRLVRPLLFQLPAERAHGVAALGLRVLHASPALRALIPPPEEIPALRVRALGREFRTPVGVAAGFDKAAEMYNALGALGFGAVEVGTVTAEAQPGNPAPRLFRLPDDEAIVNRMGFNNPGADAVARAVAVHPPEGVVLGVNLGKSKVTPLEQAADDYARSARRLGALAHYVVINVSSPNTPGLRALQSVEALRPIVAAVQRELASLPTPAPPLLVKIAPDLSDDDVDAVADLAMGAGLAGLIAANTTIAREGVGLRTPADRVASLGAGGLSGPVLRPRMLALLRRLHRRAGGALTLVAAGGIGTAEHAWEALRAGASLVQLYTALVYRGPRVAAEINAGLRARMEREGLRSLVDLVGSGA